METETKFEPVPETEQAEWIDLTIMSNGSLEGTKIINNVTGELIPFVSEIRLRMRKGKPHGTASMVVVNPKMNLVGTWEFSPAE